MREHAERAPLYTIPTRLKSTICIIPRPTCCSNGFCRKEALVYKPPPNPHRHSAAFRGLSRTRGQPTGSHPWLNARKHPAFAGCMGRWALLVSADAMGEARRTNTRCPIARSFFQITPCKTNPPAPRACGVPPCIKPTVKTVGVTPPAYPPRNAAAWRCGLAPTPAPHRAPLPPTTPHHARFLITPRHFSLHNGGGLVKCTTWAGTSTTSHPLRCGLRWLRATSLPARKWAR